MSLPIRVRKTSQKNIVGHSHQFNLYGTSSNLCKYEAYI